MRRIGLVIALLLAACTSGSNQNTVASGTVAPGTLPSTIPATVSTAVAEPTSAAAPPLIRVIDEYPVPAGSHPHDVAPAPDGKIWYTGQGNGILGRLNPETGDIDEIPLGDGASPHGVIVGPDGAAWVTDSGLNAIVRVDPATASVEVFSIDGADGNLNTAVFDLDGILWFTGQNGIYGRFDPATEELDVFDAPGGRGPYGIAVTPDNQIFYASLAGNHIARIDQTTGSAELIDPPTAEQGSRRVWSDSRGIVWVSEWNVGQVGAYDPGTGLWEEWHLPSQSPQAYAVYVDETDRVWLTDFGGDGALVRFDPTTETFESFPLPTAGGNVRQLLGRDGEVWGAESAADALIVVRFG
jgi:virginiamycin B lyase